MANGRSQNGLIANHFPNRSNDPGPHFFKQKTSRGEWRSKGEKNVFRLCRSDPFETLVGEMHSGKQVSGVRFPPPRDSQSAVEKQNANLVGEIWLQKLE